MSVVIERRLAIAESFYGSSSRINLPMDHWPKIGINWMPTNTSVSTLNTHECHLKGQLSLAKWLSSFEPIVLGSVSKIRPHFDSFFSLRHNSRSRRAPPWRRRGRQLRLLPVCLRRDHGVDQVSEHQDSGHHRWRDSGKPDPEADHRSQGEERHYHRWAIDT